MPEVDLSPEGRRKCAGCERRDTGTRWAVRWTEDGYCSARCRDEHTKARRLEALERVAEAARDARIAFHKGTPIDLKRAVLRIERELGALQLVTGKVRSLDAGHPPAGEEGA